MTSSSSRAASAARAGAEVGCWTAVCAGVWLLTLSSITAPDLVFAAVSGVLCALLAVAGRRLAGGSWRFRARWLRWVAGVPASVVVQTAEVLWKALRGVPLQGRTVEAGLPRGASGPRAAGRLALSTLTIDASPATLVLDTDEDEQALLVHTIGRASPRWARVDPSAD